MEITKAKSEFVAYLVQQQQCWFAKQRARQRDTHTPTTRHVFGRFLLHLHVKAKTCGRRVSITHIRPHRRRRTVKQRGCTRFQRVWIELFEFLVDKHQCRWVRVYTNQQQRLISITNVQCLCALMILPCSNKSNCNVSNRAISFRVFSSQKPIKW